MKKVNFFHVGFTKCSSTCLQEWMGENPDILQYKDLSNVAFVYHSFTERFLIKYGNK